MDSGKHEIERFGDPIAEPTISVIVVSHESRGELFDCLDSLREQDYRDFEILLVDNGSIERRRLAGYDTYYIALGRNYGPSYARNVGAAMANGSIVAFIDDDALADRDWLRMIVRRLSDSQTTAARGKVLPLRKRSVFNLVAFHYDLGDKVIPWYLDVEGNSAVRKSAFLRVGGFDSALFGEEGVDLSRRLDDRGGRVVYDPSMIVHHDYADSLRHFVLKNYRHGRNEASQRRSDTELESYQARFTDSAEKSSTSSAWGRRRMRARRTFNRLSGDRYGLKMSRRARGAALALYSLAMFSYHSGKLASALRAASLRKQIS
ncbi:MAG: glycosyltransferase [Gaiellaceae bacterium]